MRKNVNTLLADAEDILDDLNIKYGEIIKINVVYNVRRWGRCRSLGSNRYEIEINNELLQDDVSWESAMNTMIHEVLHAYKDRMCHTGEWKRCANLVNKEYPIYNIKRCTSAAEKGIEQHEYAKKNTSRVKYIITCNHCGAVSRYARRSKIVQLIQKNPNSCTCNICHTSSFLMEEV